MKKLKPWQIALLIIVFPAGIIYLSWRLSAKFPKLMLTVAAIWTVFCTALLIDLTKENSPVSLTLTMAVIFIVLPLILVLDGVRRSNLFSNLFNKSNVIQTKNNDSDLVALKNEIEIQSKKLRNLKSQVSELESLRDDLNEQISSESKKLNSIVKSASEATKREKNITYTSNSTQTVEIEISELENKRDKLEAQIKTNEKKLVRIKELWNSLEYALKNYTYLSPAEYKIPNFSSEEIETLVPSVELHIHSMDSKELSKAFRDNDKKIDEVTEQYKSRYTTKANQAIYTLMVIALRAELQNVLYDLKYQKLDTGIENVKKITEKYLKIACDGNQSIVSTLTSFIGQIEYLFINAVKIEYSYYVRKEQARQEQIAIRERMRQEAAERKALEEEKKKIENEENKFITQIEEIQAKIEEADEGDKDALNTRLIELESQLSDVTVKKDEIVKLQNGKAGTVYIISNLGSFGENMFKIGMTRRNNPQERVDELGDASVPFEFDVHSFIFSDDAVALENELHKRLDEKRVNKVNMRKEFFYSTIDELEKLTHDISPTAEFNRTMAAEEYKQSLSTNKNYSEVTDTEEIYTIS